MRRRGKRLTLGMRILRELESISRSLERMAPEDKREEWEKARLQALRTDLGEDSWRTGVLVSCPYCPSLGGERCVTKTGKAMVGGHRDRRRLAGRVQEEIDKEK